ncbi:phage tail tape measure protein [Aurantimonas sp. DM33-3]|uniref:phage tail tape measure protein n=1 Tax=Aurantimonas sp. DM33-3 TaxID=2766955 RepID=UPI0016523F2A|nr:phage tail tape measure protein [Aurantimonas sp. DM33-3]MBC6714805.1 phage tail tape measure protein [Aurantimonas sp. DM33-3]
MRLVDHVTGPGKTIARSLGVVDKAVRGFGTGAMAPSRALGGMARSARRATADVAGLSASLSFGIGAGAKQYFEYVKEGNTIEAVAMATAEQRLAMEQYAQLLNKEFPASNTQILGGMRELARAGMDVQQIMGGIRETLNFSLAGDFPIAESGDFLTNMLSAFRLPKDTEQQVNDSMKRVSDTIAWAANKSNADVQDLAVSMRYVAPLGPVTNQSIEEMASMLMVLADNGIKASNAGTGIRWALMSLISPTEGALQAFEKMNINLSDFITGAKKIDAQTLIKNLALDGIDASGMEDSIQRILDDPRIKLSPAKLAATITDQLGDELSGEGGLIDREVLLRSLNENLSLLGTEVDFLGLLDKLRDTPGAEAFFGDIFGKRHAVKIMAALAGDVNGVLATLLKNYEGAADRMSRVRLKGIVGAWYELTAAVENAVVAFGDSGLAADAIRFFAEMANGLQAVAKASPDLLRLAGYGVLALAVLGPLGLAAGGAAAALALMVNPLALIVGSLSALVALNFSAVKDFMSVFGKSFAVGLSPEIVTRVQALKDAVKDFFSIDWGAGDRADAVGQLARNMGLGLAEGVNTAWAAIGRLEEIGEKIRAFAEGAWTQRSPQVRQALDDIKAGLRGFVVPKIEAIRAMATTIGDFMERVGPYADGSSGLRTLSSAVGLLAAAFERIGSLTGSAITGAANFINSFFQNVDDATIAVIANSLAGSFNLVSRAFEGLASAIRIDVAWPNGWVEAGRAFADGLDALVQRLVGIAGALAGAAAQIRSALGGLAGQSALLGGANSSPVPIGKPAILGKGGGGMAAPVPIGKPALFGGKRASGGAARAGLDYLVGEKGPEIVHMGRNSYVSPTSRLGGGSPITNHFHINSTNPAAAANEIAGILQRQLNRSTQISLEDRPVI